MNTDTQRIIDKYYREGTHLRDIYLQHCNSVADLALRINRERGLGLDPDMVETAAMLHDIGIFLTDADGIDCHSTEPYIRHGILGAALLRSEGMLEEVARVAERHTGAGITAEDIESMGLPLPPGDYMPETLLEKLICYADKFYSKTNLASAKSIERVRKSMVRHSPETLARFERLHDFFTAPKRTLAIVNSDDKDFSYGGVSPIMRNMHDVLSRHFNLKYFFLPDSWKNFPLPGRLKIMIYLAVHRKDLKDCNFILSHIPEGSYIVSYIGVPFAHIYHGNTNPMEGSRYWFGKYFKKIFDSFFHRISKKADIRYTVGPVFDNVRKLPNPIRHSVTVKPIAERSGFIFAGRLEAAKNIDRIIEIYSKLPNDIRNENKLYIAGTGTLRQALEQKAQSCHVTEDVIFTGILSNAELVEIDSTKKILLMASTFEGFPTAIAEALTVGVPVVTTDVGDIPSYIKDGYNGHLMKPGFKDEEYIAAIRDILNNYAQYTANAYASSVVFNSETITENIVNDIKAIINEAGK